MKIKNMSNHHLDKVVVHHLRYYGDIIHISSTSKGEGFGRLYPDFFRTPPMNLGELRQIPIPIG